MVHGTARGKQGTLGLKSTGQPLFFLLNTGFSALTSSDCSLSIHFAVSPSSAAPPLFSLTLQAFTAASWKIRQGKRQYQKGPSPLHISLVVRMHLTGWDLLLWIRVLSSNVPILPPCLLSSDLFSQTLSGLANT